MTTNPIYDALEDAYISCLEQGEPVPSELKLDSLEFRWLMALGICDRGVRMPATTTAIWVDFAGVRVNLRSETDPEPWEQMQ